MPENFGFMLSLSRQEPPCITNQVWCRLLTEEKAVPTALSVGMERAAQMLALERVNSLLRHLARSKEWKIGVPGSVQQYSLKKFLDTAEEQAPAGLGEAQVEYADCWPDLIATSETRETRFTRYLLDGGFRQTYRTVPLYALGAYLYRLWAPLPDDLRFLRADDGTVPYDLDEAATWVRAAGMNGPRRLARLWQLLGIQTAAAPLK